MTRYVVTTEDLSVYLINTDEHKVLDTDGHATLPYVGDLVPRLGHAMWIDGGKDEWTVVTQKVAKIVEYR